MAEKRRVQLWLPDELVKRGQAAAARLPGMSLSQFVTDLLEDGVPMLEAIADGVEADDPEAMRAFFAQSLTGGFMRMLEEMEGDDT